MDIHVYNVMDINTNDAPFSDFFFMLVTTTTY